MTTTVKDMSPNPSTKTEHTDGTCIVNYSYKC